MGKTRKPRSRAKKLNPLGISSVKDLENAEITDFDDHPEGPIQAIVDQLQSISVEEKMNALQSLAIMSLNKEKVADICSSDIIRITAPLLVDTNSAIRNAAAGALRNLSIIGMEVCEYMVEQDVLTSLFVLLHEYAEIRDWIPIFDTTMNNQLDEKSDTFLQALNLLLNLCESTSAAIDNVNQTAILQSFIRCLDYKVFGLDIAIAVAQCILIISEDNPNAWAILNQYIPEFICLLNLDGEYPHTFLSALVAGIIANAPALAAAHSNQIFTALSKILSFNHREVLGKTSSRLPLSNKDTLEIEVNDSSVNHMEEESEVAASLRRRREDLPTEIELEVKNVGNLLEAQKVAAEIITNFCSPDDEEWVDDENQEVSDTESVHDYDVSNHSSSSNLQNMDRLPVEVLEAVKSLGLVEKVGFVHSNCDVFNKSNTSKLRNNMDKMAITVLEAKSLGLVEKLWQRAQPIPDNVHQILRESSFSLLKKVKLLRISALLCLQNLCNSMTTGDLGGPDAIYSVWLDIGQQVFQGPQDPLILEPATSLMRAALEHLKTSPNLFKQMTENDLQLMLNGVQNCSISEIRANWLRMLGTMGCLLPEPLVKVIMEFILDTCLKEHDVWTISEAVDAFMDIFSDNDWTQIAHDLNLQQKSKELEKLLKNKLRQQKRELKDRYPAVMTVRTNLSRFAKYIENQLKNFTPNGVR